ncbi:MAG: hypothetical protein K0U41_02030 [Gammaproteobacteria bacterium]|nr:hypothetical protein [Gammaproteobacteria bacterium]
MTISVANESKFEVTVTAPTTLDLAGFRAAAYTPVTDVDTIPEFVGVRGTITRNTVTHGVKQASGAIAQVTPSINVIDDPDDAGQTILNEAFTANTTLYGKVTYPNKRIVFVIFTVAKAAQSGGFDDFVNTNYQINVSEDPLLDLEGATG